ncbi:MAG: hypothetical protein M3464_12985 [Chloroflexota bacterium]|nr:hypothetical protein [Chloroflexota bacterium]
MKSTELRPRSVIADGNKVGDLERAYFDPKQREIVGFAITTGGGFMKPEGGLIADRDEIQSIGHDVIMLTSATPTGAKTNERYGDLIDLDTLHGREIYSDQGQLLGHVEWSEFDELGFELTELAARAGIGADSQQAIAANRIIAIGPDVVTVTADPSGPPAS